MSQSPQKVIIFGAAGDVARHAALEAQKRGATVFLAMRNVEKPIPGLTPELEKKLSFTRVKADLTDLESIRTVVAQTKATVAFTYLVSSTQDAMRSIFDAMKEAGIEHLVFLSSFMVSEGPKVTLSKFGHNIISTLHARAEVALEESGLEHTVVRPMYFDSNFLHDAGDLRKGRAELYRPDAIHDYIAPSDIGGVCGALLILRPSGAVPLNGPKLMTHEEAWKVVADTVGQKLEIKEINKDEFYVKHPEMPEPIATSFMASFDYAADHHSSKFPPELYKEASGNISKYTGREPTSLTEWARAHKRELLGDQASE